MWKIHRESTSLSLREKNHKARSSQFSNVVFNFADHRYYGTASPFFGFVNWFSKTCSPNTVGSSLFFKSRICTQYTAFPWGLPGYNLGVLKKKHSQNRCGKSVGLGNIALLEDFLRSQFFPRKPNFLRSLFSYMQPTDVKHSPTASYQPVFSNSGA